MASMLKSYQHIPSGLRVCVWGGLVWMSNYTYRQHALSGRQEQLYDLVFTEIANVVRNFFQHKAHLPLTKHA